MSVFAEASRVNAELLIFTVHYGVYWLGADGIKDLLPDTVTSGAAREAANERTSDLPSFKDVGDSLKTSLGTSSDPKDIGRAIDNNTPGAQCAEVQDWAGCGV